MTNKSHRSINEMRQAFPFGIFLLWIALAVLASGFVLASGAGPGITGLMLAAALLPVATTLVAARRVNHWPRGRQALFVSLPWILLAAFLITLSGGLSSPALVFAAFPALFVLGLGWRRLSIETAVFSLLAAVVAAIMSNYLNPAGEMAVIARAGEMYALAGLCLLPALVARLVSTQREEARLPAPKPPEILPASEPPAPACGLDPVDSPDTGELIVDVTREGRIRSVAGIPPAGLVFRPGRVFLEAFPEPLHAALRAHFASGGSFTEALAAGTEIAFTIDKHDLGTRVFLSEVVTPAQPETVPEEVGATAARLQEAERALVERTAFFAGLGHDLKTPINAILGFSDLMRAEVRGPLPETYKDYAGLIHESGQDLLLLVDDILDYARAEAGQARLEPEPVDLVASGESVMAQLSGQAQRAGVALQQKAQGEVWAKADPRAVRQIWQNLISNAIKYSEQGSSVTLDARMGEKAVALSVRDTGAGMDADDLERIAKPFRQGRNAKGKAGTGLGLAVVQRFAEDMGGKVIIDTAPGAGTRVRVILPMAAPDDLSRLEDAAE